MTFNTLLANTAFEAELAAEKCYKCAQAERGTSWVLDQNCPPDYGQMCQRQMSETMSSCEAILKNKCVQPLEFLACRKLRKHAHQLCVEVALCQFSCCTDMCSGRNCANHVADETGREPKCVDCPPS